MVLITVLIEDEGPGDVGVSVMSEANEPSKHEVAMAQRVIALLTGDGLIIEQQAH